MQHLQGLQSTTVEFDKVFVTGEPQYDVKEACRIGDTEVQLLVFDSGGSVKCGEVMVAQKGHFTFVCALCKMFFDTMPSFGMHVQLHMHLKSEGPPDLEDIADDAFNSLMSMEPGSHLFDSVEIKHEGTDELTAMLNVGSDSKKDHSDTRTLGKLSSQWEFPIEPQKTVTACESAEQSALEISKTKTCKYCERFEEDETHSKQISTSEGPLKYTCPYCPKKSNCSPNKVGHMTNHTNNSPFKCNLCPREYCHLSTLKRHMKQHHSKGSTRAIEIDEEIENQESSEDADNASVNSDIIMIIEKEEEQTYEPVEVRATFIPALKSPTQNAYLSTQKENEVMTNAKHSGNSLTKQQSSEDELGTANINSEVTSINEKIEKAAPNQPAESSAVAVTGLHTCRYCDKQFSDAETLSEHIPTHTGPLRFACPYCPKKFRASATKESHIATHTNFRPFECQLCASAYCYFESLKKHMKTNHSNENGRTIENGEKHHIQDSTNDAQTSSENKDSGAKENESETYTLAELFSKHRPIPAVKTCKFCDTSFENTALLIEHIKVEHKGNLKYLCPHCPMKFHTKEIKLNHMAAVHNITHPNPFVCRLCSKTYCYKETLRTHLKRSHFSMSRAKLSARTNAKKFEDDSKKLDSLNNAKRTSKNANSGSAPTSEKEEEPKMYTLAQLYAMHNLLPDIQTCKYCDASFDDVASYMEHIRTHKSPTPFVCPQPSKLLYSNSTQEAQTDKPEQLMPCLKIATEKNSKDGDERINESEFEDEFKESDFFQDDQDKHPKNKTSITSLKRKRPEIDDKNLVICPFCHFPYTSKWSLFSHLRKKHADRVQLPQMFSEEDYAKLVTPNPEFAMCNYCDRKFEDISEFKTHFKTSHQGTLKYSCLYCPKMFGTKSRQQMHTNIHTGERPFKCPHCPKGFAHQTNLVKHIHAHLQIKKYECRLCGKRFVQSTERKTHEKLHTGQKDYQCEQCGSCFVTQSRLNAHIKGHLNHRNFQCDQCDKAFFGSNELKRHSVVHTKERPYACDICHRTYQRVRALRTHKQVHSTEKKYECNICGKKFRQYAGMYIHRKTHGERFK